MAYANIWKSIDPGAKVSVTSTVKGALLMARDLGNQGNGMQTLITGDTGLIGIALNLLNEEASDENP